MKYLTLLTETVEQLVKALEDNGYEVEKQDNGEHKPLYIAQGYIGEVMRAMPSSNGKTYLVGYDETVITPKLV